MTGRAACSVVGGAIIYISMTIVKETYFEMAYAFV